MSVLYFICVSRLVRYLFSAKEAIAGETSSSINLLFGSGGARFRLRVDEGTVLENHPRREIGVVCSIVKEDAESILFLALSHDRHDNTALFRHVFQGALGLLFFIQVVDSRSDLVFPKSSLLEFFYGMIRGSLNSKDARYE